MEPILLAYVGIALMTGLTFIGSSYGVTIACLLYTSPSPRDRG